MSKIVAVAIQKGGTGKTTTSINLAAFVAAMGKKVLIVDNDPQGNATTGLGIRKFEASLYDVLMGECGADDAILKTVIDGLHILPSNINLSGAEVDLVNMQNRESILKTVLTPLRNRYDYIFIDCQPSLALLTVNALTAADSIIIPLPGEFLAMKALTQLMNTIKLCKKHLNTRLEVEGVVLTLYDGRSNHTNTVAEEISKFFGKKVFETKIPRNIKLAEAPSFGLPIMLYDNRSTGGVAYQALAEEFLKRNGDTIQSIDLKKK